MGRGLLSANEPDLFHGSIDFEVQQDVLVGGCVLRDQFRVYGAWRR